MRLTRLGRHWAVIGSAWLASACGSNWSQVAVSPAALESEPSEVRITLESGRRVVVGMPRIEHDSLFGEVGGTPRAIPMADVNRLALPVASTSRRTAGTAAVLSAVVVFIGGWAYLALSN